MKEATLDLERMNAMKAPDIRKRLQDIVQVDIEKMHIPDDHRKYSVFEIAFSELFILSGKYSFEIVSDTSVFRKAQLMVTPSYIEGKPESGYHFSTPQRSERYSR
jgi:hypothetical protein